MSANNRLWIVQAECRFIRLKIPEEHKIGFMGVFSEEFIFVMRIDHTRFQIMGFVASVRT